MKNTKVLSLLLLFASVQMYGSVNPQLSLVLAYQVAQNCSDAVHAGNMLASMNALITSAKTQQIALNNSRGGTFTKGVPLDSAKITAQDAQLKANIAKVNSQIATLQKNGNISGAKGSKIANRQATIKQDQNEINANTAALAVNALITKAENAFVTALEAYIAAFGQCYSQAGSVYGSTIIISSIYDKNTPITACEYNQLTTTLNNAVKVFGSSASISLSMVGSNQSQNASIQQVASYIGNMTPSMSTSTKALYGAAALIGTAALAVAAGAAYNISQGNEWNDTTEAMNVWNNFVTNVTDVSSQVMNWYNGTATSANQQAATAALAPNSQDQTTAAIAIAAKLAADAEAGIAMDEALRDLLMSEGEDSTYSITQNLTDQQRQELMPYAAAIGVAGPIGVLAGEAAAAGIGLGAAAAKAAGNPAYRFTINSGNSSVAAANAAGAATPTGVAGTLTNAGNSAQAAAAPFLTAFQAGMTGQTAVLSTLPGNSTAAMNLARGAGEIAASAANGVNTVQTGAASAVNAVKGSVASGVNSANLTATINNINANVAGGYYTAAEGAQLIAAAQNGAALQSGLAYGAAAAPALATAGAASAAANTNWSQYFGNNAADYASQQPGN